MIVQEKTTFYKRNGNPHQGFYLNKTLVANLDNYFIKAVKKKYDGVMLVSGLEGTGKTTFTSAIAKYCDPSFPGEDCARIVFTFDQIMKAIDTSPPEKAIMVDEAILSMGSQDASGQLQKLLIKKFVTIRKKRLYIFIIIPSIFLLRKYFAIFRTRALIHCYTPDGISRGYFKFYSHSTKRKLYIRGIKEFDQGVVRSDFIGRFTDTEGFFYDPKVYDAKKEEAIRNITAEPERKTKAMSKMRQKIFNQRNLLFYDHYVQNRARYPDWTKRDEIANLKKKFGDIMNINVNTLGSIHTSAREYYEEQNKKQEREIMMEDTKTIY